MSRMTLTAALLAAALTPALSQIETVRIDSLTLDRAVALGLEHHQSLRAAEANVASASAAKRQALSSYYPAINFSATGSHTEGVFVFNPSIPSRYQIYSNYSTGLAGQQTIYDFGKTSERVGANTSFEEASEEDFRSAHDNVVVNVQVAFFTYLQNLEVATVNEEAVQQAQAHLAAAKAYYSVGRRPLLDVASAEVNLANANVALIRARNQVRVAKLQLENAMGVHPAGPYSVKADMHGQPLEFSLDSARVAALRSRSDVLSARLRAEGFSNLATAAWDQHLPTISANGTWNWSGFDVRLYGRWTAGLSFTLPIFQGFGIQAAAQQAEAAAEAGQATVQLTIENALLDVEQNYLAVQEAGDRYTASTKLVDQADESLRLAEQQYKAGVGTSLDVTDAEVNRANARITRIQALYDYNSSVARLVKAMGVRM